MEDIIKYNDEEFKIQPAVPLTAGVSKQGRYPWDQLKIGDSFFVREATIKGHTVKNSASGYTKGHPDVILVCRTMKNSAGELGVRVYRIAAPTEKKP